MRDWSELGEKERSSSYGPILDILNSEFPAENTDRSAIHVLTPGCGLARLTWEIFSHGFQSEGCEFSWYMILTSRFILNNTADPESDLAAYRIHPFLHETSNLLSWQDALKEVRFPDIDPTVTPEEGGQMSFGAGEFLELYFEEKWNAVATCFFIDTAHNVIEYVEKIFKILKPGGLWINNGPLMYHFANTTEMSVELTWNELRSVILATGFELELEDSEKCSYVENPASLLTQEFKTILFTARKPLLESTAT